METSMEDLIEMLRYRRPHQSRSEQKFINRFIKPLNVQQDEYGNLFKIVGEMPTILWSAHTDSVHREEGKQELAWLKDTRTLLLASDKESSCLGADNAAGVWILTQMIKANIPGLYVFHRAEEIGGKGSLHFVKHSRILLDGIEAAIAFDRRGTKSVITHQGWGRCCSDDFGLSLAAALRLGHVLDDGGTFTDTANYVDIVPECTNISVGFNREHSASETLDAEYLLRLRDAVCEADWSSLVIKRDPSVIEIEDWAFGLVTRKRDRKRAFEASVAWRAKGKGTTE
jgi:hypothetical protein